MDVTSLVGQNSPPVTRDAAASSSPSQQDNSKSAVSSGTPSYLSPVMQIDPTTGAAVLEFRDQATGKQSFQVPSKTALEYDRQQRLSSEQSATHQGTTKA